MRLNLISKLYFPFSEPVKWVLGSPLIVNLYNLTSYKEDCFCGFFFLFSSVEVSLTSQICLGRQLKPKTCIINCPRRKCSAEYREKKLFQYFVFSVLSSFLNSSCVGSSKLLFVICPGYPVT